MPRFFVVAILALFLIGSARANPVDIEQFSLQQDGTVETTDSWGYSDCGLPTDPIQIESIDVYPNPPKPGQDLTVKVKARVAEVIEEGAYADVLVKLGLIKLLQKRFDVCEEARNANATVKCPVQPGSYTVEQTVALPREIPRAKFTVAVRGYTVEEEDMMCLDLKVDFMKNPFPRSGW